MNLQLITTEMLIAEYGDRADDFYIWKDNKRVGFINDLRLTLGRKVAAKIKQKAYTTAQTEERREAMPQAVEEMIEFLSNNLPNAEVFKNITQPNVHINGHKFYVICDPLTDKYNRLGIHHSELDADEVAMMIDNSHSISTESGKNVLVNGLSRDDIVEVIKTLCK